MLIVTSGKRNTEYVALKQGLQKTYPEIYQCGFSELNQQTLTTYAVSGLLFGDPKLYLITDIDTELVLDIAGDCMTSQNCFLISLDSVLAPEAKKLQTIFDKLLKTYPSLDPKSFQFIKFTTVKAIEKISPFIIANSLQARDRKKLWIALTQLRNSNHEPEAIHGILFWKYKDIYDKSGSETEKQHTLVQMKKLIDLYHGLRRDGGDLWNKLEEFVLTLS